MRDYRKNRGSRKSGQRGEFKRHDSRPKEMFKTKCDKCHQECEVPFKPSNNKPVYCNDCFQESKGGGRAERRDSGRNRSGRDFTERQMFQAVCDSCGNDCKIPFQPTGNKPVYCSDCFAKENSEKGGSSKGGEISMEQFIELNKKLDKILQVITTITDTKIKTTKATEVKTVKKAAAKKVPVKKAAIKKIVKKKITKKK